MEAEKFFSKMESRVDKWIDQFEKEPISVGLKVIIVVLLLRWAWRSFR